MGQPALANGDGLWIAPCNSVHTLFMRASIDVVYLDREDRVLKIVDALKPWRGSMYLKAHSVLEVGAGEANRLGWQIGVEPAELAMLKLHPR